MDLYEHHAICNLCHSTFVVLLRTPEAPGVVLVCPYVLEHGKILSASQGTP